MKIHSVNFVKNSLISTNERVYPAYILKFVFLLNVSDKSSSPSFDNNVIKSYKFSSRITFTKKLRKSGSVRSDHQARERISGVQRVKSFAEAASAELLSICSLAKFTRPRFHGRSVTERSSVAGSRGFY